MQDIILRKTGISIQPKRAEVIGKEDLEKGLEDGTIKHVEKNIYEESDPGEYETKDMKAKKKPAKKKTANGKKKKSKK